MKTECEVIRDLLPLYVDEICSGQSREIVEEHLKECEECSGILKKLQNTEIERDLKTEKEDVISYGVRKFRQLSAKTGITVSGLLLVPILAFLVINLIAGSQMGWFLIMLAAMAVAASVIAVPILVPENKLFWTFCAFTGSLLLLLHGVPGRLVLDHSQCGTFRSVAVLPALRDPGEASSEMGGKQQKGVDRGGRGYRTVPEHDERDPDS